jgi:formylglycine-generating enzyme required for sulfatase activity/class 3 adenylate cyclase
MLDVARPHDSPQDDDVASRNRIPAEHGKARSRAILMVNIAGHARLIEAGGRSAVIRVERMQSDLIDPSVVEHRGRLIKVRSDCFLAIFDSPVEAVRCAMVIQRNAFASDSEFPASHRLALRAAITLAGAATDPDAIYRESVNLATRLERLAEPGAIYISRPVHEQVRNDLVCDYRLLTSASGDSFIDPVLIFQVLPDRDAACQRGAGMRAGLLGAVILGSFALAAGWYVGQGDLGPGAAKPGRSIAADVAESMPIDAKRPEVAVVPPVIPAPVSTISGADLRAPARDVPSRPPEIEATLPPAPEPARPSSPEPLLVVPLPLPTATPTPMPALVEPEMIMLPGGAFRMGSGDDVSEQPVHSVTVAPFLIGKYPVTVGQWRPCVDAGACTLVPLGGDAAPVANVSWADAQQFATWLSKVTQLGYRLPTEAEWEYAARGGTDTRYWWGAALKPGLAGCNGCNGARPAVQPAETGTLPANPFGLHDVGGGVGEWVQDCWHKDYRGAPVDGSAWIIGDCRERALRGGSWRNDSTEIRPASRNSYDPLVRYPTHGVRLVRSP